MYSEFKEPSNQVPVISELLFQVMSIGLRRLSSDSVVQFFCKKSV